MGDRHRFRAQWHDYNRGLYFVTLCSYEKKHLFGEINEGVFYPTKLGVILEEEVKLLTNYYNGVEIWNYVIMPNHVHLIILIDELENRKDESTEDAFNNNVGCLKPSRHGDKLLDFHHNSKLSMVVGGFKAGVTRRARKCNLLLHPCWQSRFHDYIIRNHQSFIKINYYIDNNVENWQKDCFY